MRCKLESLPPKELVPAENRKSPPSCVSVRSPTRRRAHGLQGYPGTERLCPRVRRHISYPRAAAAGWPLASLAAGCQLGTPLNMQDPSLYRSLGMALTRSPVAGACCRRRFLRLGKAAPDSCWREPVMMC